MPSDLVLDLGAGTGNLTAELATTGAQVVAVERDCSLIRRLNRRFADQPNVNVVAADLLFVPWPNRPFRVVANPPFGCTTALLTRLLSPHASRLIRPHRALTRRWAPRWQFTVVRHLPAASFFSAASRRRSGCRHPARAPRVRAGAT